jgi:hypothetical protein
VTACADGQHGASRHGDDEPHGRVDSPRGTGFAFTSPTVSSHENNPNTLDSRRLIVCADNPASPSASRTTASARGRRWTAMKSNTSDAVTCRGSLSSTEKSTRRSDTVAATVFARALDAKNTTYLSSNG